MLHIGACDHTATVYVNGNEIGRHSGGYTPFTLDITDALQEDGNYITVYAEDDILSGKQFSGKQSHKRESNGAFYTRTTGIWQTVWLEPVEPASIQSYKAYPSVSDSSVGITTTVSAAALGSRLHITAYYDGRNVGEADAEILSTAVTLNIKLRETHLWELGHGRLYDLHFTIENGDGVTDTVDGYFGLREVSLTKERGLQINGKTVFGRFVLDQGFYPDGIITAPTDEALVFDIEAAIACGFNGARLHQKVFEPRYLYHADRLGYMVWGENGCWGFDHTDYANLQYIVGEWMEEIERDFSHPSIIGWCPFNETWDIDGRPQSNELINTIYDITKAMDPTRPTIATSGSYPTERTDAHDVHDYEQDPELFRSYYSETASGIVKDQLYRMDKERQVSKTYLPIFVSEYGGILWAKNAEDGWGYGNSVTTEDEFFARLEGLTDVLLENKDIFAFCYTQLTDVEQEQNGLLTYERSFKFEPQRLKRIFAKRAAIEG